MQSQFADLKTTREFHITVQFLGEGIDDKRLQSIIDVLSKIKFEPFEIKMGDAIPFPNPFDPKGVWIECGQSDELKELADNIRKSMSDLHFIPDKPFKAHITLGRYKFLPFETPKAITGEPHTFIVDKFYLMQSSLMPTGSEYKILAEFQTNK